MGVNVWSDEELRIIRRLYPEHGIHWPGWESVLPERTTEAIRAKAQTLRMSEPHPHTSSGRKMREARTCERERKEIVLPDPMEGYILKRMSDGCTLREIEVEKHWPEGRAAMILREMWKRGNKL